MCKYLVNSTLVVPTRTKKPPCHSTEKEVMSLGSTLIEPVFIAQQKKLHSHPHSHQREREQRELVPRRLPDCSLLPALENTQVFRRLRGFSLQAEKNPLTSQGFGHCPPTSSGLSASAGSARQAVKRQHFLAI